MSFIRFIRKYAKGGKAPRAAVAVVSRQEAGFTPGTRRLVILATLPGDITPEVRATCAAVLKSAFDAKGIVTGKITLVVLTDPPALEIREEIEA